MVYYNITNGNGTLLLLYDWHFIIYEAFVINYENIFLELTYCNSDAFFAE